MENLSGWTNSGSLWSWQAGDALFSAGSGDTAAGATGFLQTVTGLTVGHVYRLRYTVEDLANESGAAGHVQVTAHNGSGIVYDSGEITADVAGSVDLTADATSLALAFKLFPDNAELLSNASFTSNLSGWTASGDTGWSQTGGAAQWTDATTTDATSYLDQTLTDLAAGTYRIEAEVSAVGADQGTAEVVVQTNSTDRLTFPADGTDSIEFEHEGGDLTVRLLVRVVDNGNQSATAQIASLSLKHVYPALTGRLTRFTLQDTALIRTAPRRPIDMVRGVFLQDPLATDCDELTPIPWSLGPGCLHLAGDSRGATEAWVLYRPVCPQWTSTAWSASSSYQSGGLLENAFNSADGHSYRTLSLDAFTTYPLTYADFWEPVGVPERFAECLIQLARAEALEEQDQFAKAQRAMARGMDFLENAMLTHYSQSRQGKSYRNPAHNLPAVARTAA